ncbi:NAD(P)H-binding protein [Actinoplanes sp. NPDC049596]|uniref:NAD(P)H-binding protein n=1 Tax=unclassified Actinoplanes TaxID=2626549 RepID=UPI00342C2FAA
MILVTGATGTTGSALVDELLARGAEVTAVTRDARRIEPRPGLTVTTTIVPAEALYLLAPAGPGVPGHDLATLRAARSAGIRRVVKLSAIGTPDEPSDRPGSWHQPGEQAVRDSGLEWTILRPTTFATNSLWWAADIRAGRPITNLFGEGPQGIIDPADIAAVAAEALTTSEHNGRTYTLTGPELLTVPDQVAQLGSALGRTLTTVDAEPGVSHFPREIAEAALAGAQLVRRGGNAIITDDVELVLGREPGTYAAWAETNRNRF